MNDELSNNTVTKTFFGFQNITEYQHTPNLLLGPIIDILFESWVEKLQYFIGIL